MPPDARGLRWKTIFRSTVRTPGGKVHRFQDVLAINGRALFHEAVAPMRPARIGHGGLERGGVS